MGTRNTAETGPEYGPGILLRGPYTRRARRQQAYLATSFLAGFIQLLWLILLLTTGSSLLIVVIGLPILYLAFLGLRRFATMERRRIRNLTGERIPNPYRDTQPTGGLPTRVLHFVSDPATWRDMTHLIVGSTLGFGWFLMVGLIWILPLGALSVPFWYQHLPHHRLELFKMNGTGLFIGSLPGVLALSAATILLVWLLSPTLLELANRIQTTLGRGLLGVSRPELERREESLRMTRGQAVSAAEAERRRIERDLHDGAQQRLVALAMDLGMAKAKLKSGSEDDSEAAARLVAEAHEGVKLAVTELRDLARGIHPAVLTDRGLDAALSALAGRSPIPVEVDSALDWRPSPEIESAAYFVASEALANMAKHSQATRAWIDLEHRNDHLRLVVGDNGVGGAEANARGGLSGLADRIAPLDGILSISSPVGGPTQIIMEIPCQKPSAS